MNVPSSRCASTDKLRLPCADDLQCSAEVVFETTRQPLLVLSGDLAIKRANSAFCRAFGVQLDVTLGRRLFELGDGQWSTPKLRHLLEHVLVTSDRAEDCRIVHDFKSLGQRVLLLDAVRMRPDGDGRDDLILLAISDVTEEERLRSECHAATMLIAELHHRAKNLLINVVALALHTRRNSRDLDHFFDVFRGRIDVLLRTQDLVVRRPSGGISLRDLIRLELEGQDAEGAATSR